MSIIRFNVLSSSYYEAMFSCHFNALSRRNSYLVNMQFQKLLAQTYQQTSVWYEQLWWEYSSYYQNTSWVFLYYFRWNVQSYFITFDQCICSFQKHLQLNFRLTPTTKVMLQPMLNSSNRLKNYSLEFRSIKHRFKRHGQHSSYPGI